MSTEPPGRPRSTPIPGISDGDVVMGSPVPGNAGSAPLTPSQFAGGGSAPAFPPGPTAPTPPGAYAPPGQFGAPGQFGVPGQFGAYGAPGGFPQGAASYVQPRKRSPLGCLFLALVFIGPVVGVGIGIWAFFKARDSVDTAMDIANDVSDSNLSDSDREALGLPDSVETLWGPGAAQAVIDEFSTEIGASPLRMTQALIYTDYAFVTVQDPAIPTHIDEYGWRSATVSSPSAQQNDPELDSKLFSSTDVNWGLVNALTVAAPATLGIEAGEVSHVIVNKDAFSGALVIDVYVSGPRDSGFLEADAQTGAVLATH